MQSSDSFLLKVFRYGTSFFCFSTPYLWHAVLGFQGSSSGKDIYVSSGSQQICLSDMQSDTVFVSHHLGFLSQFLLLHILMLFPHSDFLQCIPHYAFSCPKQRSKSCYYLSPCLSCFFQFIYLIFFSSLQLFFMLLLMLLLLLSNHSFPILLLSIFLSQVATFSYSLEQVALFSTAFQLSAFFRHLVSADA